MNIYIRYFDEEALCHNMGEMHEYLSSLDDFVVTQKMLDDIAEYADSSNNFPKRYKVTARNYFIMIKTELNSLEEFHANGKKDDSNANASKSTAIYEQENEGWYLCEKKFKRVVPVDETSTKFEYVDSSIEALVYGKTPTQCHNRLVDYLKSRDDVDERCQYPAMKESNFAFQYKGETLENN